MKTSGALVVFVILLACCLAVPGYAQECLECHKDITPNIVSDWQVSKHAENSVSCSVCHGDGHRTAEDVDNVELPTPDTCADCHEDQVTQFKKGKHALAWAAMKAMPSSHAQPVALMEGMKGCGSCHSDLTDIKELAAELREKRAK